jgi:hypothetical protein
MTAEVLCEPLRYKEFLFFGANIWHSIPELRNTSRDGMSRDLNLIALQA